MTTISGGAPSIGDSLAQLISGASAGSAAAAKRLSSASAPTATSVDDSGPATFVTLSDQAKAAAAARAQSDQAAADRLRAFVEARRVHRADAGGKTTATGSLQSILDANTQSTATPAADAPPTSGGAKIAAIVAQIKTLAGADDPPQIQLFTPTKTLSNSVTYDGYTLTLSTNAGTQHFGIELNGNGLQADSQHFGPYDGIGGVGRAPPGVAISAGIPGNYDESIDAITITQNVATASSASASSSAGSVSESSLNAQSSSITFLVNYATGQISVEKSAASVSVRSASVGAVGSRLSTLA
jgi:hypothetical protein